MSSTAFLGGPGGPFVSPSGASRAVIQASLSSALTGILEGGLVTINVSNPNKYDVAAGIGQVINFSSAASPIPIRVPFGPFIGVDPFNFPGSTFTTNLINVSGALVQTNTIANSAERRNFIRLQTVLTTDTINIVGIDTQRQPAFNMPQAVLDYILKLGPINTRNDYSANAGANLMMDKSDGETSFPFINDTTDSDSPNDLTNPAQRPGLLLIECRL